MFEQFFLERMQMDGELVRIALAIIGTAAAAWYDVRNNKNVPNDLLYAFLAVAFISNLVFFQQDVFTYAVAVALIVFGFGYAMYRVGYIGGADVYILAAIALLLPVFPSHVPVLFNFPVVFSIIISSGVLFAAYFLLFIAASVIIRGEKGKYEYLLLAPAYGVLVYFLGSTGIFGLPYLVTISLLTLSSVIFMVYKEAITKEMARKVPLSKIDEEDVAVLELMPALVKKYGIKRLLDEAELARLKKLKVKEIYVYKELPPFLPFVLAALVISVLVGDILTYSIGF